MLVAIGAAKEAQNEQGIGAGIAAVIVKDGELVAVASNHEHMLVDPTAHAEVECIRIASHALGTEKLNGCILYSTLEPCNMCMGAIGWAGIETVVFGAFCKDVPASKIHITHYSAQQEGKRIQVHNDKHIIVHGGILREECAKLLN
jgi:tRNA(adenine34) deaminase